MITKEQARIDVLKFLKENNTAVVATSFQDEPRAATVYYYVDNEFNFYFITKRNTGKYINVELNPKAAIVVGTGPEHITVQAYGKGELIIDDSEKEKILNQFMNIRAQEHIKVWPIEELQKFKDRNKIVFKITPEHMLYMNLDSSAHPDTVSEEYMTII